MIVSDLEPTTSTTTIPGLPAAPTPPIPLDERGVIRGVSWDFYDRLSDAVSAPSGIRIAYDGKGIEIMVLGPLLERSKGLVSPPGASKQLLRCRSNHDFYVL